MAKDYRDMLYSVPSNNLWDKIYNPILKVKNTKVDNVDAAQAQQS